MPVRLLLRCTWPLLVPATLALALADDPPPRRFAVLVGVNQYEHDRLKPLAYAEADVIEMAQVLRDGGYTVTLLTGAATDANLRPTRANIDRQLSAVLRGCRKGDTVVVALAGHGLQFEAQPDCYFCPRDARPFKDETATLVSLGKLYTEMDKSFAGMKVLLVDACRDDPDAGRGARGVNADTAPRPPQGVAALFSCRAGERAYETDKLGHGVFFYHVLQGLKGEARDRRGRVTFASLAAHVSEEVSDGDSARGVRKLIGGEARQSPNLKADYSLEPVLLAAGDGQRPGDIGKTNGAQPALAKAPFDESRARALQKAWADYLGRKVEETVDLGGGVAMEFVLIPPGTFMMGSPDAEIEQTLRENKDAKREWFDDEKPQREVTITRPFYLGKYAVTQEQYNRLIGKNPSYFSTGGEGKAKVQGLDTSRFPVETVSWDEADAFCLKLRQQTSRAMRLPSEAEWEYACRAGTTTPFHFGSELNGNQSNCDGNYPYGTTEKGPYLERTCRVGSYRPNAFGLYDMHGNVWQWCQDYYGPYEGMPGKDPTRLDKGIVDARVLRGGSWFNLARLCRAANRSWDAPANRSHSVGLRVAFRLD